MKRSSDWVVDLKEVWDADWLVEIKSADDLLYLVDDFIHAQSALKLSAFISHKFDPPSKQTMSLATLLWRKPQALEKNARLLPPKRSYKRNSS